MPLFEWDEHNLEHLARHGITQDEVEELFDGPVISRRGGVGIPGRLRVLGRTLAGRYLEIVYQPKANGVIRAFTGWDMLPHQKELYERQTGKR